MDIVKQFIVTLMNGNGIKKHIVNCSDEFSAKCICEAIFHNFRIIDIKEKN